MGPLNGHAEFASEDGPRRLSLRGRMPLAEDRAARMDKRTGAICDVCGRVFVPYERHQKRCSFKCRQEANRRAARERSRRCRG